MQKHRRFAVVPVFLLLLACSSGTRREGVPLRPIISSARMEFSLQMPEDDQLFRGDWSGSQFDGATYRALGPESGGVDFHLETPVPLLARLRLRTEAPCSLVVRLNNRVLKTLDLKPSAPAEQRILLPRRLLTRGDNRLEFLPASPARIRFYRLSLAPPRHGEAEPPSAAAHPLIQLPARLDYYVHTGSGRLELRFSVPVPRIRLSVDSGAAPESTREWRDRRTLAIDLAEWDEGIRHLAITLDGPPVNLELQSSQLSRKSGHRPAAHAKTPPAPDTRAARGMNLVVILLDSARADRFSCSGYPRRTTPHIDGLSARAWRFENAWSEAAYTLASTATLFSGLAPDQHNAVSNYFGGLNPNITTLAEVMTQAGYFTAAVSAIPYCGRAFRMDQGFAQFTELFQQTPQPLATEFPSRLDKIMDIAAERRQPFFAYLHIREPHIDYTMPPPHFGTFHRGYAKWPNPEFASRLKNIYFARGKYAGGRYSREDLQLLNDAYDENLHFADAVVGMLLKRIQQHGLRDRTAVVVIGDHGEGLGEHGLIGHNVVLYPEGLHIPMILAIPGWSDKGGVISRPVSTSDLTATLMRVFAGIHSPRLKGKGLFQERRNPVIVSRSIFFSGYHNAWSVLEYPYQAILTGSGAGMKCRVTDLKTDPRGDRVLEHPLFKAYFFQQLVNLLRRRRLSELRPMESNLKQKEIESLKSLGYL